MAASRRLPRRPRPRLRPRCVDVAHWAALRRLATNNAVATKCAVEITPPREHRDGCHRVLGARPKGTRLRLRFYPVDKAFALKLVEQRKAEAARTCSKVVRIRAPQSNSHRGLKGSQRLCDLDTAETRHVQVENCDLGAKLQAHLHGLGAVLSLEDRRDSNRVSEAMRRSEPVRPCHRQRPAPGRVSRAPTTRCLTVRRALIRPHLDCGFAQSVQRTSARLWGWHPISRGGAELHRDGVSAR